MPVVKDNHLDFDFGLEQGSTAGGVTGFIACISGAMIAGANNDATLSQALLVSAYANPFIVLTVQSQKNTLARITENAWRAAHAYEPLSLNKGRATGFGTTALFTLASVFALHSLTVKNDPAPMTPIDTTRVVEIEDAERLTPAPK